ncbi:ribosomal protein L7/L12 [Streptomyces sp. NPDC006691]|uniref:ribosomal protein L7/L12 n=1 Tax=Streptomyces sp. NPDC006691 TaxID=3364757 RepID=UPI0036916F76
MVGTQYFELICDEPPCSVVLTSVGACRVEVLRVLRRLTGLSLWRSKELTLQLPVVILHEVARETADAAVAMLREAGAATEIGEGTPRSFGGHRQPAD